MRTSSSGSVSRSSSTEFQQQSCRQLDNSVFSDDETFNKMFEEKKPYTNDYFNIKPDFDDKKPYTNDYFNIKPDFDDKKPYTNDYFNIKPDFDDKKPYTNDYFNVTPDFEEKKPYTNDYFNVKSDIYCKSFICFLSVSIFHNLISDLNRLHNFLYIYIP